MSPVLVLRRATGHAEPDRQHVHSREGHPERNRQECKDSQPANRSTKQPSSLGQARAQSAMDEQPDNPGGGDCRHDGDSAASKD